MSIKSITTSDFNAEIINADIPVLVDFWTSTCMPCHMQALLLDKITQSLGDKIKIVKVNLEQEREFIERYNIMATPTLKLFKDGEVVVTAAGLQYEDAIEKMVAPYLG